MSNAHQIYKCNDWSNVLFFVLTFLFGSTIKLALIQYLPDVSSAIGVIKVHKLNTMKPEKQCPGGIS